MRSRAPSVMFSGPSTGRSTGFAWQASPERASLSTQNVLPSEGISVFKADCREDLAPQAVRAASLALVSLCGGLQFGHFG